MKFLNKMLVNQKFRSIASVFVLAAILFASLRGVAGNPNAYSLNTKNLKENGPFELSPERGRFTLAYSIAEDHSLFFSVPLARFVTPDLGYWNGKYVSLFAPGVSFLVIPGYLLGKLLGISQVGSFAVISIFAIVNFILIRKISLELGANSISSTLAATVFLFGTPAFAYAVNLYQHHISTFLMLTGLYLVIKRGTSWWQLFFTWFICVASALLIDYPNFFLMAPIGIVSLFKIFPATIKGSNLKINFRPILLLTFMGVILPIIAFAAFSYFSYGSPTRLAGTVPYIAAIDKDGKPAKPGESSAELLETLASAKEQSSTGFFQSRNLLNGLYIHLFSRDRGVIFYAPIVLFGLLGGYLLFKNQNQHFPLLAVVAGINLLLYSLWGDPWGGWAFGSRYLIPGYAIMAIFVSVFLTKFRKNIPILLVFSLVALYSIGVNTLGALTTSAIPPKVQVLELEKLSGTVQKYTWERNWDFIKSGGIKSFVYLTFGKRLMTPLQYYYLIAGLISIVYLGLVVKLYAHDKHKS